MWHRDGWLGLLDAANGMLAIMAVGCLIFPIIGQLIGIALGTIVVAVSVVLYREYRKTEHSVFAWGRWWWLEGALGFVAIFGGIAILVWAFYTS